MSAQIEWPHLEDALSDTMCASCGEPLTCSEVEDPDRDCDGEIICVLCWTAEYVTECGRCGESWDEREMTSAPGELIGIWRQAPAAGGALDPGYYRVLRWPFFRDGMICADFIRSALQWVADLDAQGVQAANEAEALSGPLCPACHHALEGDA